MDLSKQAGVIYQKAAQGRVHALCRSLGQGAAGEGIGPGGGLCPAVRRAEHQQIRHRVQIPGHLPQQAGQHCAELSHLYTHLSRQHHIFINPGKTMFYGTCEQCFSAAQGGAVR